jgi:hypothetical protein
MDSGWSLRLAILALMMQLGVATHHTTSRKPCGTPILYIHIHKDGGTTVCNLAKMNGLRVPPKPPDGKDRGFLGKNCNPSTPDDAVMALWSSPEDAERYAERHRVDLFMNEFYMPAALPAPHHRVRLVIMLRDPLERIVSHCGPTPNAPFARFSTCATSPHMWNFAVGHLCACECGADDDRPCPVHEKLPRDSAGIPGFGGWSPPPAIIDAGWPWNSSAHVACARRRLTQFDLVLVMERLSESAELIRHVLGWQQANTTAHRSGTHKKKSLRSLNTIRGWNESATSTALAQMEAQLRIQNHEDIQLHLFASSLLDEQLRQMRNEVQAGGRGCGAIMAAPATDSNS